MAHIFTAAASLLILSGSAALIYQVAWVRLLGLSMGSTSASVSTVLAAFFAGLALGSFFAKRILRKRDVSLTLYVVLEVVVGAAGLLLLPVLLNLDHVMALMPAYGTALALKFTITLLLLSIPTICMGATFPVMAAVLVGQGGELGRRISQLYTLNTAGAVAGAALCGFVLIPAWGLDGAVYCAVSLNMAAASIAWWLSRRPAMADAMQPADVGQTSPDETGDSAGLRRRLLLVLFLTGLVAIATEVGWTKYLAIYTGATIYGFAAILTVFLVGITAGSWAIGRVQKRVALTLPMLVGGLIALGGALVLARVALTMVPSSYELTRIVTESAELQHAVKYAVVLAVLFVPTFLFGAIFPVVLTMYCNGAEHVRTRLGPGYAVNTIGSILGAIGAGFWIIPSIGTDGLLTVMAVLILMTPFLFPAVLRRRASLVGVAAGLAMAAWLAPHLSYESLIASTRYRFDADAMAGKTPEFLFLNEGRSSVISMVTYDGEFARLQSNGIQESYLPLLPRWDPPLIETLLGLVPYLLHANPNNALVIGFGGGTTVTAMAAADLESIRVVELERAVVDAVASINDGKIAVLEDPRVTLTINDARNTLLVEDVRYDIVVSQPSHPWLAGSGNLFTQQFFEIVDSRLAESGIYAQWVSLFNMDATTLQSILQAFYSVFPHGLCFASTGTGDMLLIGSGQSIRFDFDVIETGMNEPAIAAQLFPWRIDQPEKLLEYFALSRDGALAAAGDVAPNTDTKILSEVRLAGLISDPEGAASPYELLRKHYRVELIPYFDPESAPQMLYRTGRFFIDQQWGSMLSDVIDELRVLDPQLATRLEAESL